MATAKQLASLKLGAPPFNSETGRAAGKKGGIKSGMIKKAKKTLKEELEAILLSGDTQNRLSLALLEKAIKGDVRAFEVIRDTIGQKPIEKVAQTTTTGEDVEKPLDIEKLKQLKEILK